MTVMLISDKYLVKEEKDYHKVMAKEGNKFTMDYLNKPEITVKTKWLFLVKLTK